MFFWFLTLAIAVCAIYISHKISHKLMDEEMRFSLKLIGLFSLLLSLMFSHWLIQLSIVLAIVVAPVCQLQHYYQRRIRCSPKCIARSNCPGICF